MGCLRVTVAERRDALDIVTCARQGALSVTCQIICSTEKSHEPFYASDGDFILLEGGFLYVLKQKRIKV